MSRLFRFLADSGLLTLLIVAALVFYIGLPSFQTTRRGRRLPCLNNLHNVGIAVQNFAATNDGQLPPLSHGPQETSWRVLLLPLMDHAAMYRAYHHDKPWNDPANLEFARTKIPTLTCPDNPTSRDPRGRYYTAYAFLTGPGTAYDQPEPQKLEELPNGLTQTLLAIEACGTNIVWNEPRDLDVTREQIASDVKRDTLTTANGGWASRHHKDYVNVAYADGSVRSLSLKIDPEVLKAVIRVSE